MAVKTAVTTTAGLVAQVAALKVGREERDRRVAALRAVHTAATAAAAEEVAALKAGLLPARATVAPDASLHTTARSSAAGTSTAHPPPAHGADGPMLKKGPGERRPVEGLSMSRRPPRSRGRRLLKKLSDQRL